MDPIYLDYNATTPLDPAVAQAMRPYLETHFGNPSSSHIYGMRTKRAVEAARRQVADLLGAQPDEIVFTSGGSESNNLAIRGVFHALREKGNHIITSAIEHPAVVEVCHYLESQGARVTIVGVDEAGRIDPANVEKAITPATVLITIMHANNEVGTIQPIAEIATIAKRRGVLMHTDAAQSIGKIPTRVQELGVDLLSIAGHKLYAPKGVGALYVRTGVKCEKLIFGADHERGWRAGTENVLEIVGLGKACELAKVRLAERTEHMRTLRGPAVRSDHGQGAGCASERPSETTSAKHAQPELSRHRGQRDSLGANRHRRFGRGGVPRGRGHDVGHARSDGACRSITRWARFASPPARC